MIDGIKNKLQALSPIILEVVDESDLHRGHAGHHGNGTSHVRLKVSSPKFEGLSRIECHRMVQNLLREEFAGGLHALSISVEQNRP